MAWLQSETEGFVPSESLISLDLRGGDLRGVNLSLADLRFADLSGAHLGGADLHMAHLQYASLRGTDFRGTNLMETDLRFSDLYMAHFGYAYLRSPKFEGADITKVSMEFTALVACDLTLAKGIETVIHYGPSSVDLDTIINSWGKTPKEFWEGIGIPKNWIASIPSLSLQPLAFFSSFLSYSHTNQDFAGKLHSDLRTNGVRIWYFPADARGGRLIYQEIEQAQRRYDKTIVVCSQESLASDAVQSEIEQALRKQEETDRWTLLPVAIDDTVYQDQHPLAIRLRKYVIEDFLRWREPKEYKKALDKLLNDLATEERLEV